MAETAAKQGIGRALLNHSIEAAILTEADSIVLVGDPPFYEPSGFSQVWDAIVMPGPVEQHRVMQRALRRPLEGRLSAEPWPVASSDAPTGMAPGGEI